MNKWSVSGAVALALLSAAAPASADQRPISDFTSRQVTWCVVFNDVGIDCDASYYAAPTCAEDDPRFTFPLFWSDPKTGVSAVVDSLGQLDEGEFGTTVDGSVSESALPNGLADVRVVVHAGNAYVRAFDAEFNPLFGYGRFGGLQPPSLGDALVQLKFKNTAPGAPLPDFNQLQYCPESGQALEVISLRARASGPLRAEFGVPEGTPGRLEVTQTGLIGTSTIASPRSRLAIDAFPAEKVIIRATGK
jgi:hypothetical protein